MLERLAALLPSIIAVAVASDYGTATLAVMGWIGLGLIASGVMLTLALTGLPRRLWALVGAALALGATGYAVQGQPSLGAKRVAPRQQGMEVEPGLLAFRDTVLRPGPATALVFRAADERARRGDARGASAIMLEGIARNPRDPALWAGLGASIATHDEGTSPAALFAFRRAFALAPRDPGPPFLLGLAYLQAGDLGSVEQAWAQALSLTPVSAPYRVGLADQLALVRQFRAMAQIAR